MYLSDFLILTSGMREQSSSSSSHGICKVA